jgi:hypothetical protein
MKRLHVVMLTVVLVAGLTALAAAQQRSTAPKASKPGGVVVDVVEWTGTVTAVDHAKRTATIQGSAGRIATVNAKNARNLDQVKVGDTVKIRYAEELAIFVRKKSRCGPAGDGGQGG